MNCQVCKFQDLEKRKMEYRVIRRIGAVCMSCAKSICCYYLRYGNDIEHKQIVEQFMATQVNLPDLSSNSRKNQSAKCQLHDEPYACNECERLKAEKESFAD